jgi:hypothetical protein
VHWITNKTSLSSIGQGKPLTELLWNQTVLSSPNYSFAERARCGLNTGSLLLTFSDKDRIFSEVEWSSWLPVSTKFE